MKSGSPYTEAEKKRLTSLMSVTLRSKRRPNSIIILLCSECLDEGLTKVFTKVQGYYHLTKMSGNLPTYQISVKETSGHRIVANEYDINIINNGYLFDNQRKWVQAMIDKHDDIMAQLNCVLP